MEQDEMGTEIMWKLRANRIKQILSSPITEFGQFTMSRRAGLDFNVGFGSKKNNNVNSLSNSVLLEVAEFALAMNSSQQDFIMEILEYNFDFGLQSQHQRDLFICEIMKRVRKPRSCEDAVKFSKEVFQLPGLLPSINVKNQSVRNVNIELSSESRMEECGTAPRCPYSSDETKEHISEKVVVSYPFCKEIGLKLHVNQCQPNTKLNITKLTNGAMTEVTNVAEKLCGTFEQIFLDLLRHNLDLDSHSGDSDLARDILARIPAILEKKTLSGCVEGERYKQMKHIKNRLVACSASSAQCAIINRNMGNSSDIEHQNQLHLKLWKLRASHIQQILSVPHGEHFPFYSYSRCRKLGIDFNVGSGVKQNLDPKLLINGIMLELNTFVTTLLSAKKYFITEILEYNFDLDFKNELNRSAFAQQIVDKIRVTAKRKYSIPRINRQFELPDTRCMPDACFYRTTYCPKCYQDRNHRLFQDKSDPGHNGHPHPHIMLHTVSADGNCTEQKPPKDLYTGFSTLGKNVMEDYPLCKNIGLNLFVDKDQPKDKLDIHVLTHGTIHEVANFAKMMCGTKTKIINDILEHSFNINMQGRAVYPSRMIHSITSDDGEEAWFNEVFVIPPFPHRQHGHASKLDDAFAMQRNEMKETVNKRKLALQTKKERATLPSHEICFPKKPRGNPWSQTSRFLICMEIGLDLDVTSKPGKKKKLDLKLLTKAIVLEIYKFAVRKTHHYLPQSLYAILDYNFDLRSQHHRHWEFTMATAFEVQSLVKQYRKKTRQSR
ncbi:uncharacterized protein LOC125897236 [Epinephelus fuscoguttatus]|uniref:uncharacterized protein LOC125897236 n=1 Tax=Epinephelus fuscoguttatus TaxID=293821 RepID=UPI0020D09C50|nr:uncharacterized protein LOC125897236 [Epinephelus fuscoguttatus]